MSQEIFTELLREGYSPRTLLDIGAHIGSFSCAFLQVFPQCVPTLIEPNPHCAPALKDCGFDWHPYAASDKSGRAMLFLTRESYRSTGASLYRENTHHFRDEVLVRQEVETRRIDDLFPDRSFDFVKIDTQGAELDVLRGGQRVISQADYVLLEVSVVDYNAGGARAEDIFAQMRAMGFRCADVTQFHRFNKINNGNILQLDFLFRRKTAQANVASSESALSLRALSDTLAEEGRVDDAIRILDHLTLLAPRDARNVRTLTGLLCRQGRVLEALEKLRQWRLTNPETQELIEAVQALLPAALDKFHASLNAHALVDAERYIASLVALVPRNPALLDAALTCNVALGDVGKARTYAKTLVQVSPDHARACEILASAEPEPEVPAPPVVDVHPLVRLRDIHDTASDLLCETLTDERTRTIAALVATARGIETGIPAGSEPMGWEMHYRVMLSGLDMAAVTGATPKPCDDNNLVLLSAQGTETSWLTLRRTAARMGAQTVFFAAADRHYVDLYARWYIKSLLQHGDVPFIVVIHVIGGASELPQIVEALGIQDKRLYFCGDDFDAASIATQCFDAPPKGRAEKPLAHLQSVRFQRLGALLRALNLPVFVSDIDLLLQDGVAELLARTSDADLVLNKHEASRYAGSRFTANLLLVRPSENGLIFADFLAAYLSRELARPQVSRWIDQIGLMLAQHHLMLKGTTPSIAFFDTSRDINNVMYPSYQKNPFRFLSLFHGFDMSSLERFAERDGIAPAKSSRRRSKRVA